jgi:hypothetical protein
MCLAAKKIGLGRVIYSTANLGIGVKKEPAGLMKLLRAAAEWAAVSPSLGAVSIPHASIRVDPIAASSGLRFIVIQNRTNASAELKLEAPLRGRGLFTQREFDHAALDAITIPADFIDILVVDSE